jgi:hypothetical protein
MDRFLAKTPILGFDDQVVVRIQNDPKNTIFGLFWLNRVLHRPEPNLNLEAQKGQKWGQLIATFGFLYMEPIKTFRHLVIVRQSQKTQFWAVGPGCIAPRAHVFSFLLWG